MIGFTLVDPIPPAYWTKVYLAVLSPRGQIERPGQVEIRVQRILLLIGVTLVGLAPVACARVPSHFAVPQLAVADAAFIPTIEAYTIAPVGGGNTVEVLLNGDQISPAQLAAIRSARETITYAQYFYVEGPIGREIAEALADRCRAGVRAHILLDGFGTSQMPAEYRETMTRAGCQVATFRPLSPLSLLAVVGFGRANKRNHRRILVVDGRVGFTGGSGISPKWMGDGRTEGHWRDATNNVLGGESYFPRPPRPGSVSAQIVRRGSEVLGAHSCAAVSMACRARYWSIPSSIARGNCGTGPTSCPS